MMDSPKGYDNKQFIMHGVFGEYIMSRRLAEAAQRGNLYGSKI